MRSPARSPSLSTSDNGNMDLTGTNALCRTKLATERENTVLKFASISPPGPILPCLRASRPSADDGNHHILSSAPLTVPYVAL